PEKPSILSRLAIPIALVVGAAIIGGGTFGVVKYVQNLVSHARVHNDQAKWKAAARSQVYEACYFGCNDCSDPNYAWNACQISARVAVQGVICDANKMWNWANADRYPDACLVEAGKILAADALKKLKKDYSGRYGLVTLTVLGGLGVGYLIYYLLRKFFGPKKETADTKDSSDSRRSSTSSRSSRASSGPRLSGVLTSAISIAASAHSADAYACTGRSAAHDQHFVSLATVPGTNAPRISGVIHGWFSDCQDKKDCKQKCKTTCKRGIISARSCKQSCKKNCKSKTKEIKKPKDYVDDVVARVTGCGFKLADSVGPQTVFARVGNPKIEKDLWVRVSVSGFNVTTAARTDREVECLYGIAG
ncbi:hypothetical protein QBC42DRAFT_163856, partial [Cladorrhinum samala]